MLMKILKGLWTVVVMILGALFGLIGSIIGIGSGGPRGGPRPALPPGNLPPEYAGVWRGKMSDTSPNTYSSFDCTLDLRNWRVAYGPTGPGHRGAEGDVRLVQVNADSTEVEEDIGRGASIDYAVDGIFTLRLIRAGSEMQAKWRSQYPDRDIYVGSGTFHRA